MKKLLAFAMVAALAAHVYADEDESGEDLFEKQSTIDVKRKNVGVWPAFFVVSEIPAADRTPDVVGLRVTIPFSVSHESVTGFDLGLWGRAQYFEGFRLSILRNDVKDELTGFQVGLYNSAAQADLFGAQVGLWNEAGSLRGAQAGLVNVGGNVQGIQFGLINRAEELYGFQVGLVNVIRDAEIRFCPFLNVGF